MVASRQSNSGTITTANYPMERIVIVGDGPIALFTAIKLKQKGCKNVVVVGPHFNQDPEKTLFSRSGDFVPAVFEKINALLNPIQITTKKGFQIKDAERQLYKHALDSGVVFQPGKFQKFTNKTTMQVVSKGEKGEAFSLLDCDIVYDCTGTSRAVLNQVNQLHKEKVFSFHPLSPDGREYDYLFLRLQGVSKGDRDTFDAFGKSKLNVESKDYYPAMKKMRELGWEGHRLPHAYINEGTAKKQKANLYMQCPPQLRKEKQEEWANTVTSLFMGNPKTFQLVDDSKKHRDEQSQQTKPKISHVHVNSEMTRPWYFLGDDICPTVFHMGDSSLNIPFFTGADVINGLDRVEGHIQCCQVSKHGGIESINLNEYEKRAGSSAGKALQDLLGNLKQHDDQGLSDEKAHAEEAVRLNHEVEEKLEEMQNDKEGLILGPSDSLEAILASIEYAYEFLPSNKTFHSVKDELDENLLNFAKGCSRRGVFLYGQNNYVEAAKCFKISLEIYKKSFAEQSLDILEIYAKWISLEMKRKNYQEVVRLADEIIPKMDADIIEEDSSAKIMRHQVKALLELENKASSSVAESKEPNLTRIKEVLDKIKPLMEKLEKHPFVSEAGMADIVQEVAALQGKLTVEKGLSDSSLLKTGHGKQ